MLSVEENERLTRTGPGTPMGDTLRRYWLPALLAWELPASDCPPVRVQLLGEKLVAFRDTRGRIGLLDEFCPHRRASLWLGRNEECGLRCVYHGWKFDVDGNCVDQMNEPDPFTDKIHLKAYPTVDLGGVIWAYMGPRDLQPPLPKFAWTQVPDTHRHISKVIQACNWLQALEGGIDTSHAQILHRYFVGGIGPTGPGARGRAPKVEVDVTDYGYRYAGVYPRGGEGHFVRTYHYVMPFTQLRPGGRDVQTRSLLSNPRVDGHMWVPIDDENCMVWNWQYSIDGEPLTAEERAEKQLGNGPAHVDQTTFRSFANADNNWMIDRDAQRTQSFTGIDGINTQDRAVQESMGPIVDRSQEHLGPADRAIIIARQLLLQAVKTVQDGGAPRGVDESYYTVQAIHDIVPQDVDWREALLPLMYPLGV
jgi:phthalate 4,5-dioxygenase